MSGNKRTGVGRTCRAPRRSIADLIDQKEILTKDGRRIETVPMEECAIHRDDRILKGLAAGVILQAVKDWNKLNSSGKKPLVKADGCHVWRWEVAAFFNGSFFACILEACNPDIDQDSALRSMNSKTFHNNRLSFGRGSNFSKRKQCEK